MLTLQLPGSVEVTSFLYLLAFKIFLLMGMVVHTCNPSSSVGGDWED
jgi:hypothetical protein